MGVWVIERKNLFKGEIMPVALLFCNHSTLFIIEKSLLDDFDTRTEFSQFGNQQNNSWQDKKSADPY
jgi:hypothetical protein